MKELMLFTFIVLAPLKGHSGDSSVALRSAAQAAYKQSGTEDKVNRFVKEEVPKPLKEVSANVFLIAKTIQERRVVITWSF